METSCSWRSDLPAWRGGQRDGTNDRTRWLAEHGPLNLDVGPADWRPYRTLRLEIGCEQPTGAVLCLEILGCEEEPVGRVTFVADWAGWREVAFPLAAFAPPEDEGWHLVHALRLTCAQPGREPTVLSLGAVEASAATE